MTAQKPEPHPLKREERENLQVRIKKSLHDEAEQLISDQGLKWVDVISSALSRWVEEERSRVKR